MTDEGTSRAEDGAEWDSWRRLADMKAVVPLTAALLMLPVAPAAAADITAVPGAKVVEVKQTFGISVKSRVSRKVCLFTKTDGQWNKLAACENVVAGRTFKLRVRLGTAAVGRNPYVIAPSQAKPKANPPKTRSNIFRIRVLAPES